MFPAWAGMNRLGGQFIMSGMSVPRVGGDEPEEADAVKPSAFVFPAWAGMNRSGGKRAQRHPSVPRVGGDEPLQLPGRIAKIKCSPRGRG